MKTVIKLFGIVAIMAIIAFIMVACSDDNPTSLPLPDIATYTGTASGTTYTLTLNHTRYTTQIGDMYLLTITTNDTTQISNGTVVTLGGTLTLLPTGATTTFNVTVNTTGGITHISGTITLSTGETITLNTEVTPGSGGPGTTPSGSVWPPENILTIWGISGMPTPAGATCSGYSLDYDSKLSIMMTFTAETATSSNSWFTSHGWTLINEIDVSSAIMYYWEKGSFRVTSMYMSSNNTDTAMFSCETDNDIGSVPGWLPNNILTEYGLTGMPAAAATDWIRLSSMVIPVGIGITFYVEVANDTPIQSWLTSNGYTLFNTVVGDDNFIWQYMKSTNLVATYTRLVRESEYDNDYCNIVIGRIDYSITDVPDTE